MPGLIRAIDEATSRVFPWMTRGACRDEDPEIFFPIAEQGPALAQVSAAKAACRRCAVSTACLSFGLQTSQEGIWGGTTRETRRALRPRPHAEDRAGR